CVLSIIGILWRRALIYLDNSVLTLCITIRMTNMKNMKLINLIFAISLLGLSQAALASMKVTVNGMVCSFCAQGIEKSILKLDETKAVLVDLKNKVVVVEAKEGKTLNEKLIKEEITDSGYDVVSIETSPQTVAQFKQQMKAKK
ncbi:MAG: hypothetical protein RIR83_1049, partial [Pseudomonadota bacterium]